VLVLAQHQSQVVVVHIVAAEAVDRPVAYIAEVAHSVVASAA
jgi:hypothetical protein